MKKSPNPVLSAAAPSHVFGDLPLAARNALERIEELLGDLQVAEAALEGMAAQAEHSEIDPSLPESIAKILSRSRDRMLANVHTAMGRDDAEGGVR